MTAAEDKKLLMLLLDAELTEREREAFESMLDWVETSRKLSEKQREWITATARAKELVEEVSENLWSSGKVPKGVAGPKSDGERRAATVLANRPLSPPGRQAR